MKSYVYPVLLLVITPVVTGFFYYVQFTNEIDKIFLSISTFIFSIFTGFFISRQASRFNRVRETVTQFDGILSSIYRQSWHISVDLQLELGKVIKQHYQKILKKQQWNIHFTEKSNTITKIHVLLEEYVIEEKVTKLSNQALGSIIKGLAACQDVRKRMVALYEERIPLEQWVLICFFVGILLATVAVIPSTGMIFMSLLKAAFVVSVLSVMYILYKLNNLAYTEQVMGESSAQDVLGIIKGTK